MSEIENILVKAAMGVVIAMIIGVFVVFFFSLANKYNTSGKEIITEDRYIQRRYIDQDAGVVCYVYGNGISCLPISQTDLQR